MMPQEEFDRFCLYENHRFGDNIDNNSNNDSDGIIDSVGMAMG